MILKYLSRCYNNDTHTHTQTGTKIDANEKYPVKLKQQRFKLNNKRTEKLRKMPPKKNTKKRSSSAFSILENAPDTPPRISGNSSSHRSKRPRVGDGDGDGAGSTAGLSRAGVISEIVVENIMNHKILVVPLNPRVNFITGPNGTGKSAVVAAIQLCFGASAKQTGREKALASMIRRGHEGHGYCRVTLHNPRGHDAYKYEVFGDTITIERKITRSSGTAYKIYTHEMAQRAKRGEDARKLPGYKPDGMTVKQEVDKIVDKFNINCTNPCNVLDQQSASNFLRGGEAEKYKFFEKATELRTLRDEREKLKGDLESIAAHIESAKRQEQKAERDYKRAKEAHDKVERLRRVDNDIQKQKRILHWVCVEEEETKLEKCEAKVTSLEKKISDYGIAFAGITDDENAKRTALSGQENELKKMQKESQSLTSKRAEIERELKKAKRPIKERDREIQSTGQNIKKVTSAIKKEEANISKLLRERNKTPKTRTSRKEEEYHNRQVLLEKNLEEVEAKEKRAAARRTELDPALESSSRETERQRYDLSSSRESFEDLKRQYDGMKRDRNRLEMQQGDVYGNDIAHLNQLIQRHRNQFEGHHGPMVPVGRSATLKVECASYAQAVEHALGEKELKTLLVNTQGDRKTIMDLARRNNVQIRSISCFNDRSGSKKQIPQNRLPPPHLKTVERCIDVNHPWVYNYLVFATNMHQVAIVDESRLVEEANRNHSNVNGYYSKSLTRRARTARNGNTFFQPIHNPRRAKYLQLDRQGQLNGLRQDMQNLKQEMENSEATCKRRKEMYEQALQRQKEEQREIDECNETIRSLKDQRRKISNELRALKEASESAKDNDLVNQDDFQIQECQDRLEYMKTDKEKLEAKRNTAIKEKEYASGSLVPIEARLSNALEEKKKHDLKMSALNKRMDKFEEGYVRAKEKEKMCQQKLDSMRAKLAAKVQERNFQALKTEKDKKECIDFYGPERIKSPQGETAEQLEATIKLLEEQLRSNRASSASIQAVTKAYETKAREYTYLRNKIAFISRQLKHVFAMKVDRDKRFKGLQSYVSKMSSTVFNSLLRQTQQSGHVDYDHDNKTLGISVQLEGRASESVANVNDAKQLSGGERSSATLALLLALIFSTDYPFSVLDEFDVCMDEQRRSTSIAQLVKMAQKRDDRQFIFLTPHSLASLELTDDKEGRTETRNWIDIFVMPDKE